MFTRRLFIALLLAGVLIAANLGTVIQVKGEEQNQLDSALTSVSFQLPFHGRRKSTLNTLNPSG